MILSLLLSFAIAFVTGVAAYVSITALDWAFKKYTGYGLGEPYV